METKSFEMPVSDWTKVKIDNALFILNEAKDYLKNLSDISVRITARAFSILTVLIPITSALIAYLVGQSTKGISNIHFIIYYVSFIIIVLIVIMFFLGILINPRGYMPLGRRPVDLCSDEMLGVNLTAQLSIIALVLSEIETCQAKIDFNERQNIERTNLLKRCIKSVAILFALSSAALLTYTVIIVF